MTRYTFDVKTFISITIQADSIESAIQKIDTLDGNSVNLGLVDDEPVVETISFDGEHDLTEIDGEAPCYSCGKRAAEPTGHCKKCRGEDGGEP